MWYRLGLSLYFSNISVISCRSVLFLEESWVHSNVFIHFCDSMCSFWVESNLRRFFIIYFVYVLSLEIQLSRDEGLDLIYLLTTPTPSQIRTYITNVICRCLFFVEWVRLRWEVIVCFVDICGIDYYHCLNFLFNNQLANTISRHLYANNRIFFDKVLMYSGKRIEEYDRKDGN